MNEEYINFDAITEDYDYTRAISDKSLRLLYDTFIEVNGNDLNRKKLLEIGCGTGRISKIFASTNYNVTGIDISEKMVELARQKAKDQHWSFTGVVGDARNLPFKENEFDMVYAVHVLELIKDWKKVIKEGLRCSLSKRFVTIDVERVLFKTDLMSQYWTFVNNSDKMIESHHYKRLGAQNTKEIITFMDQEGYNCTTKEFEVKTNILNSKLLDIIQKKSFLVQQKVPEGVHKQAIEFLRQEIISEKRQDEEVELFEKGTILNFFKR